MTLPTPVLQTAFEDLTLHRRGKVRDVYEIGDDLLMIATDRISAFDWVLGSGIPDKGKVLTQISAFWFDRLRPIVPNHVLSTRTDAYPAAARPYADILKGRSMLVRRTTPFPVECVARGYLSGSGWKEYQETGSVCGIRLPDGLQESARLPQPIFTPATKAESGHDINISEQEAGEIVGRDVIARLRELTLALYTAGAAHAESRGIIVADTKFEFGVVGKNGDAGPGEIILIDEALTPDSSRFWPMDRYTPGTSQPSFDKQYVRDYLERIHWNKQPPVPSLPDDVIAHTRAKYVDAFRLLSGRELNSGPGVRYRLEQLVDEMLQKGIRFDEAREELERRFITRALAQSNGNLAQAAEKIGVHRNTFSRKMQQYRIKRKAPDGDR